MTQLRTLLSRLAGSLGGRGARDEETDEEIRLHIELLVSRFTVPGMSGEEARWAAGNPDIAFQAASTDPTETLRRE